MSDENYVERSDEQEDEQEDELLRKRKPKTFGAPRRHPNDSDSKQKDS